MQRRPSAVAALEEAPTQQTPDGAVSVVPRSPGHLVDALDTGVAVIRPRGSDDISALGLSGDVRLVVLAQEHPDQMPPELTRQRLAGEDVLVLSWLAKDGWTMSAAADVVYAWAVDVDTRLLAVRVVTSPEDLTAPLAPITGVGTPVTGTVTAEGPDVFLDPAYLRVGIGQLFQAGYGIAPAPVDDGCAVAIVRSTASGRSARALGTDLLADGARARLAVPIDAGLPAWGPREGTERVVLGFPSARRGRTEWLLELE